MAAGLPAAVTRNGGPSESLYDEATGREFGILVDPADPVDIASGLLRLVGPENEWRTFQEAGTAKGAVVLHVGADRRRVPARVLAELGQKPPAARLSFPAYFLDPSPETDLPDELLADVWKPVGQAAKVLTVL